MGGKIPIPVRASPLTPGALYRVQADGSLRPVSDEEYEPLTDGEAQLFSDRRRSYNEDRKAAHRAGWLGRRSE